MQRITIEQLRVPTLIGVYDWERTQKTILLMTIELDVDVTSATLNDNVDDTVDYAQVANHVQRTADETAFELLEALGRTVCESVLATFPVSKVKLKIEKPDILPDAKTVHVTMAFDKQGPAAL